MYIIPVFMCIFSSSFNFPMDFFAHKEEKSEVIFFYISVLCRLSPDFRFMFAKRAIKLTLMSPPKHLLNVVGTTAMIQEFQYCPW